MITPIPGLRVVVVIASVLIGASVFGSSASATQPECKAINQTKDTAFATPGGAGISGTLGSGDIG